MYTVCKDGKYYAGIGVWVSCISTALIFDFETAVSVACCNNAIIGFICGNLDFLCGIY